MNRMNISSNRPHKFIGGLSFEAIEYKDPPKYKIGDVVYSFDGDILTAKTGKFLVYAHVVVGVKLEKYDCAENLTIYSNKKDFEETTGWNYLLSDINNTREMWIGEYKLFTNPMEAYEELVAAIKKDIRYWKGVLEMAEKSDVR